MRASSGLRPHPPSLERSKSITINPVDVKHNHYDNFSNVKFSSMQEEGPFRKWANSFFFLPSNAVRGTKPSKLIHPKSTFYVIWSVFMAVLLLWISVSVPYRLGFDSNNACDLEMAWLIFDFAIDTLFVIDLILNFGVCFSVEGYLIDDKKLVAKYYVSTDLTFDVIKCLPVGWVQLPFQLATVCSGNIKVLQLLKILKGLRILRLVRLASLKRFLSNITIHSSFMRNPHVYNLAKLLLFLFFSLHCVACLWWAVKQADPKLDEWMIDNQVNDTDYSKYLICFYFSITTLMTVGYGDISGRNDLERLAATGCMFVGGLIFAAIISNVSNLFVSVFQVQNMMEAKKERVISFMQSRRIPLELQKQIIAYFNRFNTEESLTSIPMEIIDELPMSLKFNLLSMMALSTLTKVHMFRNLDPQLVMSIFLKLSVVRCAPGEIVIRENSKSEAMYFIMQGGLLILRGEEVIDELAEGDVYGVMNVFGDEGEQDVCVVTKDFAELYALRREDLETVTSCFPGSDLILHRRAKVLQRLRDSLQKKDNKKLRTKIRSLIIKKSKSMARTGAKISPQPDDDPHEPTSPIEDFAGGVTHVEESGENDEEADTEAGLQDEEMADFEKDTSQFAAEVSQNKSSVGKFEMPNLPILRRDRTVKKNGTKVQIEMQTGLALDSLEAAKFNLNFFSFPQTNAQLILGNGNPGGVGTGGGGDIVNYLASLSTPNQIEHEDRPANLFSKRARARTTFAAGGARLYPLAPIPSRDSLQLSKKPSEEVLAEKRNSPGLNLTQIESLLSSANEIQKNLLLLQAASGTDIAMSAGAVSKIEERVYSQIAKMSETSASLFSTNTIENHPLSDVAHV